MAKEEKKSKKQMVLEWLQTHDGISMRESVTFGCYRLSGRIYDLRAEGYDIDTEYRYDKKSGATYGVYHLRKEAAK